MASRNLGSLTVDLLLKMGGFKQGMDAAARETDRATSRIKRSANQVSTEIRRMGATLIAGFASVATIRQIVQVNDEYTRLEGRLGLVTRSAGDLARVQEDLFAIAQRTRTEYAGVADLYVKLAQTSADLGASQSDLLRFTEAVGNALTISGASAQTASGALLQLSQGLAGGVFRAEEFNSVLEGAPEIIRTVAKNIDGMGGSMGKLREAIKSGQVTSQEFFRAFLAGGDDLAKRAETLPLTVGQAFTRLQNVIKKAVAEGDLSPLADAINELSETVSSPSFQEGMSVLVSLLGKLAGLSFKGLGDLGATLKAFGLAYDTATLNFDRIDTLRFSLEQLRRAAREPISVRFRLVGAIGLNKDVLEATTRRLERQLSEAESVAAAAAGTGRGPSNARRPTRAIEGAGVSGDLVDVKKLTEQTRTAVEEYDAQILKLARSLQSGAIDQDLYNRGLQQANELLAKDTAPPKAATSAATAAARAAADALEDQAQAYQNIYTNGVAAIEGLRTPLEEQLANYHEQRYALEQLAATYPNLADEAADALNRLALEGLAPIEITAEKIFPPQEQEKLSVFFEEASRSVQGILADFIFEPFENGLSGLADSFAKMLQRMAAEAIAADIAGKIFGTGVGSGGGLLGQAFGFLGGLFGGAGGSMNSQGIGLSADMIKKALGGFDRGGYTGDGAKLQPAGIVHAGEFVTRSEVTRQPGAVPFLESFNRVGMAALEALPGFAAGGLVAPAIVPARGPMTPRSSGAMAITNYFTIHAPTGTVSRATETQIAAAAARGAGRASARNN